MTESSVKKKIAWAVLCLVLVIWGLTDVRQRAHFDPVLAAKNSEVIAEHRTDLTVFTETGAAFFDGRDPYEVTNPRGWMYLYPPLFAIIMAPLHALPPQWQGVTWYFLSLAMAWGCCREITRLLHRAGVGEFTHSKDGRKTFRWIQIAAATAILFPTLDCLQRGQVGILILYLVLLGLRLVMAGDSWKRTVAGGMVLALSIVFKIIPVVPTLFLLFLLMVHRIKKAESTERPFQFLEAGAGVLAGLLLFFFVMPSLFIGWQSNTAHLKTWSSVIGTQAVETSVEAHFSNPRGPKNQSLSNALYHTGNQIAFDLSNRSEPNPWLYNETAGRFMNSPAATQVVLVIRVLLALLLIPLAWRRSGSPLDRLAVFGLACVAMLVVSPVARGHYFMLELPAVLFVSLWVWKYKGVSWAVLCASVPAALSVMHYTFITFPQMFGPLKTGTLLLGTLGIGTALWYAVMTYVLVIFSPAGASSVPEIESSGQGFPSK
jgi:glycosyl transferase family 87